MKLTRVKNTLNQETEIMSSRSFVEKFYSEFTEYSPVTYETVSKIDYPDPYETDKMQNSSNFSIDDSISPKIKMTQETEVKTGLIKKFEEFLENLNSDELQSNESEILNRLIKMNEIRSKLSNKEKKSFFTSDLEVLKRKYENLLIENNELDLEIINGNMKIRERKNSQVKGLLEIQRFINQLQAKNVELSIMKDTKKGNLIQMMQELNQKEFKAQEFSTQMNDTLLSKELIVNRNQEHQQMAKEIQKKRNALEEITQKNQALNEKIKENQCFFEQLSDLTAIEREIENAKDKIKNYECFSVKLERDLQDFQTQHKKEMNCFENEFRDLENEEKNDSHHFIIKEKYEDPMQFLSDKRLSLQQETQNKTLKYQENIKEISQKIESHENKIRINREKIKETSKESPKKIQEFQRKKEDNLLNSKEIEKLRDIKKNELNELENILKNYKEEDRKQKELIFITKSGSLKKSKELKSEFESQKIRNLQFHKETENLKTGFFESSSLKEKKDFVEDLRIKVSLIKELRNRLGENINDLKEKSEENKKNLLKEEEINLKNSNKLEELNKEINKFKDDINKCTKDNEEVCGRFKSQIEENSMKEKELKNSLEIMEKFKVLTENQMNEINKFNEKNNFSFKEIAILEKGDLKEWNNYLKEKEKIAKKKKK